MKRRQFVTATGAVIAVPLAGCLGDDGDANSPESISEEFYKILVTAPEDLEDTEGLFHPDASFEIENTASGGPPPVETINADVEVVLEDVDAQDMVAFEPNPAEFNASEGAEIDLGPAHLSATELNSTAAREEIVLTKVTFDADVEGDNESAREYEQFLEELPFYALVATNNGEWLILDSVGFSVETSGG